MINRAFVGRRFLASLAVFCSLIVSGLRAQSTNNQEISGQVLDATGSAVAGAKIVVLNKATDLSRSAVSNDSGNFVVSNLPIGRYEISAATSGFKKLTLTRGGLVVDAKLSVTLKLEVGSLADSMTIQADAAQIETNTGEVGRL